MAWKLKKSKTADSLEAAELPAPGASDPIEATWVPKSNGAASADDSRQNDSNGFFAARVADVEDTVSALQEARQGDAAKNAEEEDWSQDPFALYKPSQNAAFEPTIEFSPSESNKMISFMAEENSGDYKTIDFGNAAAKSSEENANFEDTTWGIGEFSPDGLAYVADLAEPLVMDHPASAASNSKKPATVIAAERLVESAPPLSAAIPSIIVRIGNLAATYELVSQDMAIGRPDPNTGALPDVAIDFDDAISRRHAHIFQQGGCFYAEDLGSKNGTLLNGQTLPANVPTILNDGDRLRVGERTEIIFQA